MEICIVYKEISFKPPAPISDGWHICKSAMIVLLCLAVVFYVPIFGIFDILLFGFLWNFTFNTFYNRIFKL